MDPLVCKGETTFPLLVVLMTSFFALVLALLGVVLGVWALALPLGLPVAAGLWYRMRRAYRLTLYQDHLELSTGGTATTVPYAGSVAELRLEQRRTGRGLLNGHQPLLCLRREGRLVLSVSRTALSETDARRVVAFLQAVEIETRYLRG